MGTKGSCLNLKLPFTCLTALMLSVTFLETPTFSMTASVGRPYHGRLQNGVAFPTQFPGYHLRDQDRSYATPEAIATVLDAIDTVRERFPDTCNLFIGDFSLAGGGPINMHRSHQNGRDADLGMYARGNRPLDTFAPMNDETLDVAKTWCFVESLLRSQHIQYIFLDRRIQRQLHEYALSQGGDPVYLERVFANGRNSPMQHVGGHYDHMHVRFYTPWSTMAARISEEDVQQRTAIETAQQAYLPQKVNYFVKGNERGLEELAGSFGVQARDLCRWNQLNPDDPLTPGACLVFYKRSFEVEPVHLARSLQPDSVPDSPGLQFASAAGADSFANAGYASRSRRFSGTYAFRTVSQKNRTEASSSKGFVPAVYTADKQDTLQKIAKDRGIDLNVLCQLNGLSKNAALKPGQKIRLCEPDAAQKSTTGSQTTAKATTRTSQKQQHSSPSTLQKNMKSAPAATKANTSLPKAQGAQKSVVKTSATTANTTATKTEKKTTKKP